jgi:hypothetical protein
MANKACLGCGADLTSESATLEHVLPQWLAKEIERPGINLEHSLHDERRPEQDTVLRSHGLNKFATRKVCAACNNGWMSRLESGAKPLILGLMYQKTSILTLTDEARLVLSRWATKTAFMISRVQSMQFELPWATFQRLGEYEKEGPQGCLVLGSQQPGLPKGFLYTCPSDEFPVGTPVQLRVGFSIHHLHFVVVIPIVEGLRMISAGAAVHVPMWPLDLQILSGYKPVPEKIETPNAFLDFLTNLVAVGIVQRKSVVHLELEPANPSRMTLR